MSDQRLRELERAARSGDHQARVAWLRERVRADVPCQACDGCGLVKLEKSRSMRVVEPPSHIRCPTCAGQGRTFAWRLHLACWCFDPAAWEAHQGEELRHEHVALVVCGDGGKPNWLDRLQDHSQETHVRVAYAAALATLEHRVRDCPHQDSAYTPGPVSVELQGKRALACYHRGHKASCLSCDVEDEALESIETWLLAGPGDRMGWAVLCDRRGDDCDEVNQAVAQAAWAVSDYARLHSRHAVETTRLAVDLATFGSSHSHVGGRNVRVGVDAVLTTLQRDVVPWALGERDPVRERAEARKS